MTEILENLRPELLLTLPPALNVLGAIAKKSGKIEGKGIQFLLIAVSVVLCLTYVLGTSCLYSFQDWTLAVFFSITQGIAYAGTAIGVHQVCQKESKT